MSIANATVVRFFIVSLSLLGALSGVAQRATPDLPHLTKDRRATQLIVDGKPFLILGGELHNSSSSGLAQMSWLVIGSGDGAITFSPESPGPPQVAIESINEEILENGKRTRRRRPVDSLLGLVISRPRVLGRT